MTSPSATDVATRLARGSLLAGLVLLAFWFGAWGVLAVFPTTTRAVVAVAAVLIVGGLLLDLRAGTPRTASEWTALALALLCLIPILRGQPPTFVGIVIIGLLSFLATRSLARSPLAGFLPLVAACLALSAVGAGLLVLLIELLGGGLDRRLGFVLSTSLRSADDYRLPINPNELALPLLAGLGLLPLVALGCRDDRGRQACWTILLLAFVLSIQLIILTSSRGMMLAIGLGLAMLVARFRVAWLVVVFTAIPVCVTWLAWQAARPGLISSPEPTSWSPGALRLLRFSDQWQDRGERGEIWRSAAEAIATNPLLGPSTEQWSIATSPATHNAAFGFAVLLGIPGAALFGWLLLAQLRDAWRQGPWLRVCVLVSIAASGMTMDVHTRPSFWIALALTGCLERGRSPRPGDGAGEVASRASSGGRAARVDVDRPRRDVATTASSRAAFGGAYSPITL